MRALAVAACLTGVFVAAPSASAAGIPLPPARPGLDPTASFFQDPLRMANGFAPFKRSAALPLPDLAAPRAGALTLQARLTHDSEPLSKGVRWRVFSIDGAAPLEQGSSDAEDGEPVLVADTREGKPSLDLTPGVYVVNARFGAAAATARVMVGLNPSVETLVLDAGAMRITSLLGPNEPAPEERVSIDVFSKDPDIDPASRITKGAEPGALIKVPAGSYIVVSRYGEGNAVRRTKVRVEPGRLTDAQVVHAAAEISFKLVARPGGEALAGTSWTVLTPGGDAVMESEGAYAGQVLAAGEYVAVARLGERSFNRTFTVRTGEDAEIELIAE